mmetsp:Transcript_49574/g.128001  ORF Transcript_49574/g.128001 Transcript_49574/m.128001 type:complete len:240 (+) Transcript_49574:246-965(+)
MRGWPRCAHLSPPPPLRLTRAVADRNTTTCYRKQMLAAEHYRAATTHTAPCNSAGANTCAQWTLAKSSCVPPLCCVGEPTGVRCWSRPMCHAGMRLSRTFNGQELSSRCVRLKRSAGSGCPSGQRARSSRRPLKHLCAHASRGRMRASGSYCRKAASSDVSSWHMSFLKTVPQLHAAILGNEKLKYCGFMARTSFRDGAPRTLTISTSWSTPFSPGKRGRPRTISASTHPMDHRSTAVV